MEIGLCSNDDDYIYFSIDTEEECYYTSRQIAKLFNLTIEQYNKILIKKVIQHDRYLLNNHSYNILRNDITFKLSGTTKRIYIERFKEAFNSYIMLVMFSPD